MLYSRIEGEGKPLVIIHGFMGMSDNWKTLGSHYVAQGFQVHLLDLRNHGKSFHSDDFNYNVMSQDLLEYCDGHQLDTVFVIGHSMGGKVAMLFATSYPERVDKLVVGDIGPKYYAPHHTDILAGLNAVDFTEKPDRATVEEILYPYIPDFGTRQFLMKNLYWLTPGQLAFRFNLAVFNKEIEQIGTALPTDAVFENPTLFIRGGNSNYVLDADMTDIKKHFPNAQLETMLNVGHWIHAENPQLFFEKTIAFLK
ncbi:MAG: alpha/beta fold hydrolase [Bacteroidota bacterium]